MRLILFSFLLILFSCSDRPTKNETKLDIQSPGSSDKQASGVAIDLEQIKKRGKLIALTNYSTTSYFLYKGQPMGYEYELLKRLAKHLEVELEIILVEDLETFTEMLNSGKGDIIALELTITNKRKKLFDFTDHHSLTKQVLVQRKPDNWRKMKLHEIEKTLVRDPIDLIGKKVYVKKGTAFVQRLKNLSEEIGGEIEIIEAEGHLDVEDLIRMVEEGKIDYTVTDKHVANINETFHSNLDVETAVSFNQRVAWAVRKSSPDLKEVIDEWIGEMKKHPDYYVIYNKYFHNKKSYKARLDSELFSLGGGKISSYDHLIKKYASTLNWDWRLLASLISHESEFDPKRKSWAGAEGLMQLMPPTGHAYGAKNLLNPEENIKAGTAYLKFLEEHWKNIPDSINRMRFVLASYNAGEGHVQDARRLAEKHKKKSDSWKDVAQFLLLKSKPEYYNDEVVKYGYCRGKEPCLYVDKIFRRYEHYKKLIPAE